MTNARQERELLLSCRLESVTTGRHFVRDTLLDWDLARLVEDAELGVSELVANAVRYAKTDVTLTISVETEVTIAVIDSEPRLRRPFRYATDDLFAESGRGLRIVAAVADDWGIEARSGGKAVWFSLALPDRAVADAELVSFAQHADAVGQRPGPLSGPRTAVGG
jgi:anti-sigma regulatory factor (Ser/Thr protein kinase)